MSRWRADSYSYRRMRRAFLATHRVCWLCGHDGADNIDHVIPVSPPHNGAPFDQGNWRPAHGVKGCPTCGRKCNQQRGVKAEPVIRSRNW